jgi:hypothetical protein
VVCRLRIGYFIGSWGNMGFSIKFGLFSWQHVRPTALAHHRVEEVDVRDLRLNLHEVRSRSHNVNDFHHCDLLHGQFQYHRTLMLLGVLQPMKIEFTRQPFYVSLVGLENVLIGLEQGGDRIMP